MIHDFARIGLALGRRRHRQEPPEPLQEGVLIGRTAEGAEVRFPTPTRARAAHALCIAASGSGKSAIVAHALVEEYLQAARADSPSALFIIDPKGDLVRYVLGSLAHSAPEALGNVAVLDPFESSFALNLSHVPRGSVPVELRAWQCAGLVAAVSTGVGSLAHLGTGARQHDLLAQLLLAAMTVPHPLASPLLALDALHMGPKGFKLLASVTTSVQAREFLEGAVLSPELVASTAARLRLAFSATPSLEQMMAAPSSIEPAALLAPGRVTILDVGRPTGGIETLTKFFSNLVARQFADHLLDRPSPWGGHHVRVVLDEAQICAEVLQDVAERILTTGRSRGVSLLPITQGVRLLEEASSTLVPVLLANTNFKLLGRLAARDAEMFAREIAPRLGIDESISSVRARFAAAVSTLEDREFFCVRPGVRERMRTIDLDLPAHEAAAAAHAAEIAAARTRYAVPSGGERLRLSSLAPPKKKKVRRGPPEGEGGQTPLPEPPPPRSRWG